MKDNNTDKDQVIAEILSTNPLFSDLDEDEFNVMMDYMNIINVQKGEILFNEGEKGDYACFITEGVMDIIKDTVSGYTNVLVTLSKGQSIGEMSVIENTIRNATLLARTDVTIVTLSQEKFNMILDRQTAIGIKVLKGIAKLLSLNMQKVSGRLKDYMQPLN